MHDEAQNGTSSDLFFFLLPITYRKRLTNLKSNEMLHTLNILPEQLREWNDALEFNSRNLECFREKKIGAREVVLKAM